MFSSRCCCQQTAEDDVKLAFFSHLECNLHPLFNLLIYFNTANILSSIRSHSESRALLLANCLHFFLGEGPYSNSP